VDDLIATERFAPLMQFFRAFGVLFGLGTSGSALPMAVNLHAEYSTPDNPGSQDPAMVASAWLGKSRVKVIWNSAPAQGGSPQDPAPPIPSSGFIVEMSCYPKGFQAAWVSPSGSNTGNGDGAQTCTTGQYQMGDTGLPLVIFGGEDSIRLNSDTVWPSGSSTTLPNGSHPVYFFRDRSNPELIRRAFGINRSNPSHPVYYNQRRFFVPKESNIVQMVSGGNYSLTLDMDKLPMYCPIVNGEMDTSQARRPQVVYVRVIPVSSNVTAANCNLARWVPKAHVNDDCTKASIDTTITLPGGAHLSDSDLGVPSEILAVNIPSEQQDLYGMAVQTAIAIITLSRSDLRPADPTVQAAPAVEDRTYRPTGLESLANEVSRKLRINNPDDYYGLRGVSPRGFQNDLYHRIVDLADDYIHDQGDLPASVMRALEGPLHDLVNWKWSDTNVVGPQGNPALRYTILQSFASVNATTSPISRNRRSTQLYYSQDNTPAEVLRQTDERWLTGTFGALTHPGTIECAPVIGPSSNPTPQYWFARDLIPADIYAKASLVMSVTSDPAAGNPTPQGSWKSKRMFAPGAPTGTMLSVLNGVDGFLNTVLSGTQSVADGILRVIEFLEQRVMEIQELIKRIETYLDIPFEISFPSAKVLFLITNGTAGVMSGLVGSQEKPQDGVNAYAGGIVLVAGSAPTILTELLAGALSPSGG
jgi:hypothetical protein